MIHSFLLSFIGFAKQEMKKKPKVKRKQKSNKSKGSSNWGWVDDNLEWLPTEEYQEDSRESEPSSLDFSIITWNVLADSYCSMRSHRGLPEKFQRHVFDRPQRQHHVRQILRRFVSTLGRPILALQEVDAPLQVNATLKELGYQGIETPTSLGGKMGRVDACGLYFDSDKWKYVDSEIIQLDDLATLRSKANGKLSTFARSNLQGLQSNFVRKNMGLLVRLESLQTNSQIVIAVPHLYWNPYYGYVKLCQIHYVLERTKLFCKGDDIPIVLCGDFNSDPGSHVYRHITTESINARMTAPWYRERPTRKAPPSNDTSLLTEQIQKLEVSGKSPQSRSREVRYMLDFTLNRFCRWLRILGVDAMLETEDEEKLRTKDGKL